MTRRPQDALLGRLLAPGAAFVLGLAHGAHDVLEGDPAVVAFLPAVTMTLQVLVLSWGESLLRRWQWSAVRKLVAAILVSLLFGAWTVAHHPWSDDQDMQFAFWFPVTGMLVLGLWSLVVYFPRRLTEEQLRALAAESERRKAELARLRSNLHPHFLLNTLNAVAGLQGAEPRQARQLVAALGDLLRDSLEEDGGPRSLGEEVEWLRRYAQIFEIRHRGQITFAWDVAPEMLSLSIPRLLLQPLLENAINHGALKRPGGGEVRVSGQRAEGNMRLVVADNGPGMPTDKRDGLGLRLVRDRLALAFPEATMTIETSAVGTAVLFDIPCLEVSR